MTFLLVIRIRTVYGFSGVMHKVLGSIPSPSFSFYFLYFIFFLRNILFYTYATYALEWPTLII